MIKKWISFTSIALGVLGFSAIANTPVTFAAADTTKPFIWNSNVSPKSITKNNVTIQITAHDLHSGIDRITKPDGSTTKGFVSTYIATNNGDFTFLIYDNSGNSYAHTVYINNIDKTPPTIESLNLTKNKNDKFDVTANIDDDSGVSSVKLKTNTETSMSAGASAGLYFLYNSTTIPTNVVAVDKAGNTATFTFLPLPTYSFNEAYDKNLIYKNDINMSFSGNSTLRYKIDEAERTCTSNPCKVSVTKNSVLTFINQSNDKKSAIELPITNIDKNNYKLILTGGKTSNTTANINWNLDITSSNLICENPKGNKTFSPSTKPYSFTVLNETYSCILKGKYQGHNITSEELILQSQYQEKPLESKVNTFTKLTFKKVYKESSRRGQTYFLGINRSNTSNNAVPIPTSMR